MTAPAVTSLDTETHRHCPACAHDLATHDATSLRYCQATRSSNLTRHCICR